jgi:predicted transcriptional regulator of viral defense system
MQHNFRMNSTPSQTNEQAVLQLAQQRQLLRARDLQEQGLPTITLTRLVSAGKLERIARGVYSLPNTTISEHNSLAQAAVLVPRGVICLMSALRVHEIGTEAPFEVWMAIPHHMLSPRIKQPTLRVVRTTGQSLTEGIELITIDGVNVPIFNAAKTITDCFKFRNKIGLNVALEALREGWHDRKVTMDDLWRYAVINRVTNVMRPYLESLIA